ncbi:MAG: RnfABCDGE type electron transport complex subunit G [Rikenellaceae bacterium]|nr:RnfABCDGE type electron transport complex subunit G [Rikenellaceae bacterium]
MESTLKNMILALLAITLISAGALSVVYSMTKDAIEQSKGAKTVDALGKVLPGFDNNPAADTVTVTANNLPVKVYTAKKGNAPVGYAVESITRQGYSGNIRLMVGFLPDGEIYNIRVLEHNETPGLGSKIADEDNPVLLSFKGKSPAGLVMKVTRDGGDIDAITASTISSRAYTDAVERAFTAFREVALGEEIIAPQAADFLNEVLPPYKSYLTVNYDKNTLYRAKNAEDEEVGTAVESTVEGYGGPIRLLVGFLPDGTVNDIAVVEQMETPGFGAEIADAGNPLARSFIGRNPSEMKLTFRSESGEVDALSGSSITSQAYVDAVRDAYRAFVEYQEKTGSDE